jgi:hypothetical protein
MAPNQHQQRKLEQLQEELSKRGIPQQLPRLGESDGYLFTQVDGVTVVVTSKSYNLRGGFKVPALRKYTEVGTPTNLDAAADAGRHFRSQKKQDDTDLAKACGWDTGHLGPIVDLDWYCNSKNCPCHFAAEEDRDKRKKRSGVSR